ncbi:MAG: hypothetical protein ABSB89_04775 [Candidatus Bathyarchaeia archaeon]
MIKSNIRLYVKSVKTVTGNIELDLGYEHVEGAYDRQVLDESGGYPYGPYGQTIGIDSADRPSHPPNVRTGPKEEYVLPDDQKETVKLVRRVASKLGLGVEVVDVARENVISREIQKQREKIRVFPTLIVSSGERIEGALTEEQVKSLLSRS